MKKLFRTFKELAESPLAESDVSPEKILLDLNLKFGIQDALDLEQFSWILTLTDLSYHSFDDQLSAPMLYSTALSRSNNMFRRIASAMVKVEKRFISEIIIQNIFNILFKTNAWNSIILNPNVSKVIEKLKYAAKVKIDRSCNKYINRPSTNRIAAQDLFEIWSEMLDRVIDKQRELLKQGDKTNGCYAQTISSI